MYKTLRTIHLLLASLSLPFLVMYGVSAVQMAHGSWFSLKPAVTESTIALRPGLTDARAVARDVSSLLPGMRGELTDIKAGPQDISLRLVVPGTVHEIRYRAGSGETRVKTSVAGFMGMLNRLHHAGGLWHEVTALNLWGAAVGIVSVSLLLLGASGLCMWFIRRTERRTGAVLLATNLVVVITLIVLMRRGG